MRDPPAAVAAAAPDDGETGVTEPTGPFPPRYWWLKRLATAGLLILILLVGLRLWWGWKAHHLLRVDLGHLAARGEPLAAADLNPGDIPASDNAALPLAQAAALINPANSGPASSMLVYQGYPPFPPAWHQSIDQAVAVHGAVYPLVRQARQGTRADYGIRVTTPAVAVLLPHLNSQRQLALLLADTALRSHLQGDDAAALELVRDLRVIGRAIDQGPAFVVTHLVRVGIDALAMDRIIIIAPELTVAPDAEGATPATAPVLPATAPAALRRPASRRQVRELIAELLDEAEQGQALRRAVSAERVMQVDTSAWATGNLWLLRPMFDLDARRMVRNNEAMHEAARQPDLPAAKAAYARRRPARPTPKPKPVPAFPGGPAKPNPVSFPTMMSTALDFAGDRAIERDLRMRTERRMAAVALAVRLYRLDHGGAWPASLQELVPRYLPAVPLDPLAAGDKPLGYVILKGALPGGGDRPLVYSVGENGVDDTAGVTAPTVPTLPNYDWLPKSPDQWRDLSRWAVPTAAGGTPATQPGE